MLRRALLLSTLLGCSTGGVAMRPVETLPDASDASRPGADGDVAPDVTAPRDGGAQPDVVTPRDVVTSPDVTLRPDAVAPVDAGAPAVPDDTIAFTGSLPAASGETTGRLTVDGVVREMLVRVPSARGASPPLLVMFHGTNDSPDGMVSESGARGVVDERGVILVAPQAREQHSPDWDHPDDGAEGVWWETYPSTSADTNPDLKLVRAILVAAQRAYHVDPSRVYFVGHSNGAFFTQLAAMTLHDRVAAWASSSGGLCACPRRPDCMFMGSGTTCAALARMSGWCSCGGTERPGPINTAARRPPAYITHGTGDDTVSVYFSCALDARLRAAGYEVETVLRDGAPHVMPDDFAATVWPWLARHVRP